MVPLLHSEEHIASSTALRCQQNVICMFEDTGGPTTSGSIDVRSHYHDGIY